MNYAKPKTRWHVSFRSSKCSRYMGIARIVPKYRVSSENNSYNANHSSHCLKEFQQTKNYQKIFEIDFRSTTHIISSSSFHRNWINFDEIITNFENIEARKGKLWTYNIGHRSVSVECFLNLLLTVSFYRYVWYIEYDTLILMFYL